MTRELVALETLEILELLESHNDKTLMDSVEETELILETPTLYRVVNANVLDVILELPDSPADTCVLNFASAKHPGGGWLRGARAQEEDLTLASTLYKSLLTQKHVYDLAGRSPYYPDWMIWSPKVEFFRNSKLEYLTRSESRRRIVNVISSPAVNIHAVKAAKAPVGKIPEIMTKRIRKVLELASAKNQSTLILGAWGCGVFGLDPRMIAAIFKEELEKHQFQQVIFAVLDNTAEQEIYHAFASRF